ncbi:MAG: metallophosphoesterase [Balneolaceae bacterium]|nr:metallophosphoesterase [Balneolaceae bacterium]MDR9408838.1 metallophosphoesterase [Balneolaceae bacterium]
MVHIFLSDVHLGIHDEKQTRKLEKELIRLVDYCQSNSIQIHILGDFFDYWMEFPDYIPSLGQSVLDRFESYNEAMGNNTTFITGNHDFWTVSHLEKLGFNVEHEYVHLQLGQNNLFLCHGDGLNEDQFKLKRPLLHRFIRHPKFVTFYKFLLPGKNGLQLMKKFSNFTRDENYINTERLNNWAEFMIEKFNFDLIVSGHDHVPRMETFPEGTYINTGSFHQHRTVLKYNKGAFELVSWNDGLKEFQPFEYQSKADLNGQ